MFKKILVPIDGSKQSYIALENAITLQSKFDSELLILTVFRHYSHKEASMSMAVADMDESMDEILRKHATHVAEEGKQLAIKEGSVNVRAFVKNGPPARTIVDFSKKREIDLIVLGSRGEGDLESFLLGSVSHKVTGLASCPVLVV